MSGHTTGRALLDAIHKHMDETRYAVDDVLDVARALRRVGMIDLASELQDAVRPLNASARAVCDAWVDNNQSQISHGNEMVRGMLLLGVKLATEAK